MNVRNGRKILALMLAGLVITACLSLFVSAQGDTDDETGVCYLIDEEGLLDGGAAALDQFFTDTAKAAAEENETAYDPADKITLKVVTPDDATLEGYKKAVRADATSSIITVTADEDGVPTLEILTRDYDFDAYDTDAAADALSAAYAE